MKLLQINLKWHKHCWTFWIESFFYEPNKYADKRYGKMGYAYIWKKYVNKELLIKFALACVFLNSRNGGLQKKKQYELFP